MNKQLIFGTLAIAAVIGGFFAYAVVRVTKTTPQNTPDAGSVQQEEVSQDSMHGAPSAGGIAEESATGTGTVPTTAPSPSVSPVTVSSAPTRTQTPTPTPSPTPVPTPIPTPTPSPTPIPTPTISAYTLAEVGTHSGASSCWMAIRGKVYDVTSYIGRHPGGNTILKGCGKDATAMFEGVSGHLKQKTLDLLPGFYKGDLKD